METYSRGYFSLCLFLAISGWSRTQRKLDQREKYPIYGITLQIKKNTYLAQNNRRSNIHC